MKNNRLLPQSDGQPVTIEISSPPQVPPIVSARVTLPSENRVAELREMANSHPEPTVRELAASWVKMIDQFVELQCQLSVSFEWISKHPDCELESATVQEIRNANHGESKPCD